MRTMKSAEFAETYDVDRYAEMTLDVAESILGVFGLSRTQLAEDDSNMTRETSWRSCMAREEGRSC